MKKKEILVTAKGLEKAKAELIEKKMKLKAKKALVGEMIDAGDLSENDGYTLALEDSLALEGEVAQLEDMLSQAKVVKGKTNGKVEIGDRVKIEDNNGRKMDITIVGENEANPLENKISHNSPLGKAILGNKKGDTFTFVNPKGEVKYRILDVLD